MSAASSRVAGPSFPLLQRNIWQVLEDAAARAPGDLALVSRHQRIRLSWAELRDAADRVAGGLWSLGLRPGDRIGVWASNCAEWIQLQYATARIGAVLVNVNPAYRAHELRYVLARSGMKALFLHARDARAGYLEILAEARRDQADSLEHAVVLDDASWDAMLASGVAALPVEPGIGEVANIQYTSGTTGEPKGVLLTHRNLVNNALLVGSNLGASARDRLCAPVPMYHCFGCVMSSLMCAVHGAALVLPSAQFDALAVLEAVAAERCTMLYGVPTMFIAELEHPRFREFDLTSLRTGIMAGAPCPVEVMRRVTGEMHCREITIAYGQTESSPVITMSAVDDALELRVATVGRVLPETEVKVISAETGETLPRGQAGELCARGYLIMSGYDGDAEATRKAIDSEGWLHTGDLAVLRDDGYFHIRGRIKDTIIRGGENIYPREVEEFLHTHPEIAEAQVVGLPDERLGETVAAWIRRRNGSALTAEQLRDWCRGKVAYFKIPQYIRFVEAYPLTTSGKVRKFRMREIEIEERGLGAAERIQTA